MGVMKRFYVNPGWRIILKDMGLNHRIVLKRAGLPEDLFSRERASISTDEYFSLWSSIEVESSSPNWPLTLSEVMSVESFDPAVFAALCSSNLNIAIERIGRYKKLMCPMNLTLTITKTATTLELDWLDTDVHPPASLVAAEIVFFVQIARMATRTTMSPTKVVSPCQLEVKEAMTKFLGIQTKVGKKLAITFSAADASRPFLTANEKMWKFFEPVLQKRLSDLEQKATFAERVKAALLELLPSGAASIGPVSEKLHVSKRTLQRRLKQEGESYQALLQQTRESLAKHYLKSSKLSGAEISFLLGFEDPNSFFRAFRGWTGATPEQVRRELQSN